MSSSTTPRNTKTEARERKAAELRRKAEAARKREARIRIGAAVAVVLVVVGAVVAVALNRGGGGGFDGPYPKGAAKDSGGGIVTGSGPVTMDVYFDYQCPACQLLETSVGTKIEQLADAGKAKVVYHPLSFLDSNLRNDSSTRAANAAGCAADAGVFPAFHLQVFKNQPQQEGTGYTDAQLQQLATTAGVTDMDAFKGCMADKKYAGWVTSVQQQGENDQVSQTPTVKIDGRTVKLAEEFTTKDAQGNLAYDPAKVEAVVTAAATKK